MLISPGYMGMKTGSDCAGEEISVCAFRSGLRPAECACTPSFDPVIIVRYNSIRNLILPPVEGPFCFRPPPQQDGLFSLFLRRSARPAAVGKVSFYHCPAPSFCSVRLSPDMLPCQAVDIPQAQD